MNQLMLIVVVLVAFVYFGGSNVPKVLRDNKEILLGLAGGLVLCSFFGLRLEGFQCQFESKADATSSAARCKAEGHNFPNTPKGVTDCREGIRHAWAVKDVDIRGRPCAWASAEAGCGGDANCLKVLQQKRLFATADQSGSYSGS